MTGQPGPCRRFLHIPTLTPIGRVEEFGKTEISIRLGREWGEGVGGGSGGGHSTPYGAGPIENSRIVLSSVRIL